MANANINGDGTNNAATLTNPDAPGGGPGTDGSAAVVTTSNATVSGRAGDDAYFNVNFQGGNDTLVGENAPWVNPQNGEDEIGFDQINMGAGEDYVELTDTGFRNLDMGGDNDTLKLYGSGGENANLGGGNDVAFVDQTSALAASDDELEQKVGEDPLVLNGENGTDTLRLEGDWTLTLTNDVTLNDGSGDTVTDIFTSADVDNITGFPSDLDGTVTWGTVTTGGGDDVPIDVVFRNFEEIAAACFTAGTVVETDKGFVAIETLREGDLVKTRRGFQPVRWTGTKRMDHIDLMANPKMLPIRVPAGAFGGGLPTRDVLFSPQHRVVVRSAIVDRVAGSEEALVAVKHLVGYNGIEVAGDLRNVCYVHIATDEHDVVTVEGIESETLHFGSEALKMLPDHAVRELTNIFPDIEARLASDAPSMSALPFLKGRQGRAIAARHGKHEKPLIS